MDEERPGLPAVDPLKVFVLRFIQNGKSSSSFPVAPGQRDDFSALFGLIQRVRRLAQAYVRLSADGFGVEAEILVRAALEHAITAQWAYLTIGGVDRLRVAGSQHNFTLMQTIYRYSNNPERDAIVAEAKAAVIAGPGLPKITQIVKELDVENGFLTQTYKVLSQVTHVTDRAQLDAFDLVGDTVVVRAAPADDAAHPVLYALASACMLSGWILADLTGDEDELEYLKEASWELTLPARMDFRLPPDRRRFEDDDRAAT